MPTPQGQPEATEIWSERASTNDNGKRTAHRAWFVINVLDEVAAIAQVPEAGLGQQHPVRSDVTVRTHGGANVENGGPFAWKVTAEYSNDPGNQGQDQQSQVIYDWDEQDISLPADRDFDGNPIVNSALDAIDPPDERPITVWNYAVTWWVKNWDARAANQIKNYMNNGQFVTPNGTFEKGEVLLKSWRPVGSIIGKNQKITQVTAKYEIRDRVQWKCPAGTNPFDVRHLDQGFDSFRLSGGNPIPTEILFTDGKKPSNPVRLDGGGGPFKASNFRPSAGGNGFQSLTSGPKGATIERLTDAVFLWYRMKGYTDIGGMLP